jgi:uncharacterized repeat protein (TIGR03803 family)
MNLKHIFAGLALLIVAALSSPAQFTFQKLHSFSTSDGGYPQALIGGSDGRFYGVLAPLGGTPAGSAGAIFSLEADGSGFAVIHTLATDNSQGAEPAHLVQGTNGALYGATAIGGPGFGTIFKLNTNGGSFTVVKGFDNTAGAPRRPQSLVIGSDGLIYGLSFNGGSAGRGTFFRMTHDGVGFIVLFNFVLASHGRPLSPLIEGSDGRFYGTTLQGGASGDGLVYAMSKAGERTELRDFAGSGARSPSPAPLFEGSDGFLYGCTELGGANNHGTLYRIAKDGSGFTILKHFNNLIEGAASETGVIEGIDGSLYGATEASAFDPHRGSVFRINKDGSDFNVLFQFTQNSDGLQPKTPLIQLPDGGLIGTMFGGGDFNFGTAFRVSSPVPTVARQPAHQTNVIGAAAEFSVLSFGAEPMHFQWLFDGSEIAGAHSSSLVLTNLQFTNAGKYTVVITNNFGATTSAVAQLTLVPMFVSITGPATNVVLDTLATFSSSVVGEGPFAFQWRHNELVIADATNSALEITNTRAEDAGEYSLVVSNAHGAVTSAVVTMTVVPPLNLAPVALPGWSGGLVLSRFTDVFTNSIELTTNDLLYAHWSVANLGSTGTTNDFTVELRVNGAVQNTWTISAPFGGGATASNVSVAMGRLPAGTNTIELRVDNGGAIAEVTEADNQISVAAAVANSAPDLSYASIGGEYLVTSKRTGTTVSDANFTIYDPVLLDFRVVNAGSATWISTRTQLRVNGAVRAEWVIPPLRPNATFNITDFALGSLPAGTNRLEVQHDVDNVIAERWETDNVMTKTIVVSGGTLQLLPANTNLPAGTALQLSAFGGVPPYTFSAVRLNSGGSINGAGAYVAGNVSAVDTIRVRDALNAEAIAYLAVVTATTPPLNPPRHRYAFTNAPGPAPAGTQVRDSIGTAHGFVRGNGAAFLPASPGSPLSGRIVLPGGPSSSAAYVDLPNRLLSSNSVDRSGSGLVTIEGWYRVSAPMAWQRVFDFGATDIDPGAGVTPGELTGPGGGGEGREYFTYIAQENNNVNSHKVHLRHVPAPGGNYERAFDVSNFGRDVHFAITWNESSGEIIVYEDGAPLSVQHVNPAVDRMSRVNDVNVWLGRSNWTGDQNFMGEFDEFRLYNYVLSPTQVRASFINGSSEIVPSTGVTIVAQPTDQVVTELGTAQFALTVNGFPPFHYQWFKDGAAIPGARQPSLVLSNVSLTDHNAEFSVIVSNHVSGTPHVMTSAVAVLSVSADTTPPAIARVRFNSPRELEVTFTEAIEPLDATNTALFSLTGTIPLPEITNIVSRTDRQLVLMLSGSVSNAAMPTLNVQGLRHPAAAGAAIESASVPVWNYVPAGLRHRYTFNAPAASASNGAVVPDVANAGGGVVRAAIQPARFTGDGLLLPGGRSDRAPYVDLPNGMLSTNSVANGGSGQVTFEGWVRIDGNRPWSRIFDMGSTGPCCGAGSEINGPGGTGEGIDFIAWLAQVDTNPARRRWHLHNRDEGGLGFSEIDFEATPAGSQVHFAFTWDEATGAIRLYENGVQLAATNTTAGMNRISDVNVWLGRSSWTGDQNLQGEFDEFRAYNRVLSPAELSLHTALGPDQIGTRPTAVRLVGTNQLAVGASFVPAQRVDFLGRSDVPATMFAPHVTLRSTRANVLSNDASGRVYGLADGTAELILEFAGLSNVLAIVVGNGDIATNSPPLLVSPIPAQSNSYGGAFALTLSAATFTNAEAEQTLTYSASGLPPGIAFNPVTREFTGTSTSAGTFHVSVVATDDGAPALSATNTFVFEVAKAPLTIRAANASRVYGGANPAFTLEYLGFLLGDAATALDVLPIATSEANALSSVGVYPVALAGGSDDNYGFVLEAGQLTITPAAATVTAFSTNRVYGARNPVFAAVISGLVNGDDITATASSPTDTNTAPGAYPLAVELADPNGRLSNYIVTTNLGTLTIERAELTVTVFSTNRVYGATNPLLASSVLGLVNGDEISVTVTSRADTFSPPGDYPLLVTLTDPGTKLANYQVKTNAGVLTITCAELAIQPELLPLEIVGVEFAHMISASNGAGPVTFAVSPAELPSGLTFSSTGLLSGTVLAPTNLAFAITATDTSGCVGTRTLSLVVRSVPELHVSTVPSAIVLSWSTNYPDFALEWAGALPSLEWMTVPAVQEGDRFAVTNGVAGEQQFFRLRRR